MSGVDVQKFFAALPAVQRPGGQLLIYGPFNYGGQFTSPGNARFDASLRAAAPHRGIRDFEAVDELARAIGLVLHNDHPMPANNRCLAWRLGKHDR